MVSNFFKWKFLLLFLFFKSARDQTLQHIPSSETVHFLEVSLQEKSMLLFSLSLTPTYWNMDMMASIPATTLHSGWWEKKIEKLEYFTLWNC
jgi:hypothetical protein